MWNRKGLKSAAKEAFKRNYWRCVAVALIIVLIVGGPFASAGGRTKDTLEDSGITIRFDLDGNGIVEEKEVSVTLEQFKKEVENDPELRDAAAVALVIFLGVLSTMIFIVSLLKILVFDPLRIGFDYFFVRNSDEPAKLGEIGRGFSPAWWHNVLTMFLCRLFTHLWGLLFVIPGVVKKYSYRLTPYIQAENPEMRGTEAITLSRRMMRGHKWEAFVFDLSFLGWEILGKLTAGIVDVLWTRPYHEAANAELYRAIRDGYRED